MSKGTPETPAENQKNSIESPKAAKKRPLRYRVNPVEATIFLLTVSFFVRSFHSLINDSEAIQAAAIEKGSINRKIASPPSRENTLNQEIEVKCSGSPQDFSTTASTIRIKGPLCHASASAKATAGISDSIVSLESKTHQLKVDAYVDPDGQAFVTSPIPLKPGANHLILEQLSPEKARWISELKVQRDE